MRIAPTAVALALALALAATPSFAQTDEKTPVKDGLRGTFDMVKDWTVKAAQQVSEDLYSFQPTPEVRTLGQLFGHVANANLMMCSAAAGAENPGKGTNFEKLSSKDDIVKGLTHSFMYCGQVFDQMTAAKAQEMMQFFGRQQPRLSVLAFNTAHDYEHYGNIVTYMRLNGLVPPSSQGGM